MNIKQTKNKKERASRYTFHKQRKHGCFCMDCLHQCHELEQTVFREPPDHPCYRAWSCFFIIDCCNLLVSFGRRAEYWCCTFQSYGHTPTLSSLYDLEMEFKIWIKYFAHLQWFFLFSFFLLEKNLGLSNGAMR